MSDVPQGPGWWRASNGLYYPPEARPGARGEGPGGRDGDHPPGDDEPRDQPSGHDGHQDEPDEPATPAQEATAPVVPAAAAGAEPEPASWRAAPLDDEPEPPKRRRWGRVLLVVLLLVAVAAAAGAGVWVLLDDDSDTPTTTVPDETAPPTTEAATTTTEDTGEIPAVDLSVGDCFDTAEVDANDGFVVTTVFLVDCDEDHRAEVFDIATLETPAGEAFPGVEARDQAARDLCEPAFERFVGVSLAESDLVLIWLAPTEESWDGDDREVACAVGAPDDETLDEPVEGDEPAEASQ